MTHLETHSVNQYSMPCVRIPTQSVNDSILADCFHMHERYEYVVVESPSKGKTLNQLENQRKADRLTKYLQELQITTDDLDPQEVAAVSEAWAQLYRWSNQRLKVPKVGFGNEDGCVFVWEDECQYFELEFVDGQVEYFTKSKLPGMAEGTRLAEDFATMADFVNSQHASNLLAAFSID